MEDTEDYTKMTVCETVMHIKKHPDRNKVIELLEEALKALSEEYNVLSPKIREIHKEMYIDMLDEQIELLDYTVDKMMKKFN